MTDTTVNVSLTLEEAEGLKDLLWGTSWACRNWPVDAYNVLTSAIKAAKPKHTLKHEFDTIAVRRPDGTTVARFWASWPNAQQAAETLVAELNR